MRLRKRGMNYRDIAAAVRLAVTQGAVTFGIWDNYDERDAWKDVWTELKRVREVASDDADALRTLELERIDTALSRVWARIENEKDARSQDGAILTFLRLSERRAKLLGLDAPTKIAATDGAGNDIQQKLYMIFNPDDWPDKGGDVEPKGNTETGG